MDLSQLKIPSQKSQPSIMRSVSWMWILTGVILLIVGLWSGVLYFVLSPYKQIILQNSGDNEVYTRLLMFIDYLPLAAVFIAVLASANIYSGIAFRQFKEWALKAVQVLSYIMLFVSALFTIFWVRVWMFAFEFAPNATESHLWQYVGLFTGLAAGIFYVGVLVYFVRSIRMKAFREAYHNKTII